MPSILSIRIANGDAVPNGNAAVMSLSGANNNPNQATWTANDDPYSIGLPAAIWNAPPGSSLNFTVPKGQTSAVYTLKTNAPTGLQGYSITELSGDVPPKILIQP